MHWDKEQHTSLPKCSDGPIFTHVTPLHHGSKSRTPLTKHSTAAEVQDQTSRAAPRAAGFRFNSTATTQLCSADTCPGIHQKLCSKLSPQAFRHSHTQDSSHFASCPAPALSLSKTCHRASPGTRAHLQTDFAGISAGMVRIHLALEEGGQRRSLWHKQPFLI